LKQGCFYLKESPSVEVAPDFFDKKSSLSEDLSNVWISDEIKVTLSVAHFNILEAVPFFWEGSQGFAEESEFFCSDSEFSSLSFEDITLNADDVSEVEVLK